MGMITINGLMEIAVIYFILWRSHDQTAPVLPSSSSGTATLGDNPALCGSATWEAIKRYH